MNKVLNQILKSKKQHGAVSLFVVIFSAFLFVAVTVGFTVLMVSDQNRATDSDLAQSARDSAEAGIEEAKRVLAQLESCNQRGGDMNAHDTAVCARISEAVSDGKCGTVRAALGMSPVDAETIVQKQHINQDDKKLDQAFTCVKISPNTPSYEGRLDGETDMRVVPVRAEGDVSKIRVSWVKNDASVVSPGSIATISPSHDSFGVEVGGVNSSNWEEYPAKLPRKEQWNSFGSVLRVGSFQYPAGEMNLAEIDSDSRTAFLYPTTTGAGSKTSFRMDEVDKHTNPLFTREDPRNRLSIVDVGNIPQNIRCNNPTATNNGSFLCSATFDLAQPITSTAGNMRTYLTVSALYNSTEFRVELIGSDGNIVRFQNVQPEVDVTGRASNVLRRLVARVESADANRAPYPRAALGSTESICKAYMITDSADEYTNSSDLSNCPDVKNPASPW